MLELKPLDSPFGRAVHGLDISEGVDWDTCRVQHEALYRHRVLVIKDQTCGEMPYLEFGRQWGEPIPHVIDTHRMLRYPGMLKIGNVTARAKLLRNSAAFWHTD